MPRKTRSSSRVRWRTMSTRRASRSYATTAGTMRPANSSSSPASVTPSVRWLEIWNQSPVASLPSPWKPRTARCSSLAARFTFSISLVTRSARRCTMTPMRMPQPTFVGHAVRYPQRGWNAKSRRPPRAASTRMAASKASRSALPERRTWMRTWSSSLTISENRSSGETATARGESPSANCLDTRWRSQRSCRSRLGSAARSIHARRSAASAPTRPPASPTEASSGPAAARTVSSTSRRCGCVARPTNGKPATFRASRTRQLITTSRSPFRRSLPGRLLMARRPCRPRPRRDAGP